MGKYWVYITPDAFEEMKAVPGNFRQRIKRAISSLSADPVPAESKLLDLAGLALELDPGCTLHRIRMDRWRIVYSITEPQKAIDILTIRRRPPYDYGDLKRLLASIK